MSAEAKAPPSLIRSDVLANFTRVFPGVPIAFSEEFILNKNIDDHTLTVLLLSLKSRENSVDSQVNEAVVKFVTELCKHYRTLEKTFKWKK